jgi:calcineurin-like phosphoesterase family protein
MFDKWNDIVKPHDIVYHLGDVYIGKWDDRIAKLPGRKRLVIGNHDQINDPNFNGVFSKIMLWRIFTEYKICLTHIPIHMSDKKAKYDVNVHGHIHTNKSPTRQHINVSVEAIDFAPVSIDTLAATIVHKDVGPPLYDA